MSRRLVLTLAVAAVVAAGLAPILVMAVQSLIAEFHTGFAYYRGLVSSGRAGNLVGHSLALSFITTLLTIVFGVPLGILLGKSDIPLRRVLLLIFAIPLVIPPYVLAVCWFNILGRGGFAARWLGYEIVAQASSWLFGLGGCVLVMATTYLPIVLLITVTQLSSVPPSYEEAARLTSGWPRVLWSVTLPLAAPGISLAAVLVFLLSLGEFGVPIFLRFEVFPVSAGPRHITGPDFHSHGQRKSRVDCCTLRAYGRCCPVAADHSIRNLSTDCEEGLKLIEFQSVSKSYNGRTALHDFTLSVAPGERLVILGPSGCGKTTVLRLLAGFITPDTGSITIGDEFVSRDGRNLREPEHRDLGMVFQDLALWPHLSVKGNLELGLRAKRISSTERKERIYTMLRMVEIDEYLNAKPSELSGGQQQRVALARALVLRPKALLMDEPLSNLDEELNRRLRKEILRLQETLGFTLFYVTHDREESAELGTRVVFMKSGEIERIEGRCNNGPVPDRGGGL